MPHPFDHILAYTTVTNNKKPPKMGSGEEKQVGATNDKNPQLEELRAREAVSIEDIEALDIEVLPVWLVSKCLHKDAQGIRESIRRGIVPWGYVMGKATFVIPRRLFLQYHTVMPDVYINTDLDAPRYTNRHYLAHLRNTAT